MAALRPTSLSKPARMADGLSSPKLSRGVTLVELLVVLAILAGVAALASPSLSKSLAGHRVDAAARDIATSLRQSRARAIGRQDETVLVIDVAARSYTAGGETRTLGLPEGALLVLNTARSERLGEHRGGFRFFPDGSSTGGTVAVHWTALSRSVRIDWLTGLIELSD